MNECEYFKDHICHATAAAAVLNKTKYIVSNRHTKVYLVQDVIKLYEGSCER